MKKLAHDSKHPIRAERPGVRLSSSALNDVANFEAFESTEGLEERQCYLWIRQLVLLQKTHITSGLLLTLLLLSGCASAPPPALDLSTPGWTILQGQALWHRKGSPDLAGELLLATNVDARAFVQFSKPPISLITAQSSATSWAISFPPNHNYRGMGAPPRRLLWLYLPKFLSGIPADKDWTWEMHTDSTWRLEDRKSGQAIEGFLKP